MENTRKGWKDLPGEIQAFLPQLRSQGGGEERVELTQVWYGA